MNIETTQLHYASWGRRFGAFIIDFLILLPLAIVQTYTWPRSPLLAAIMVIPVNCLFMGYFIICHARWGKTIGKHIMGTRVANLNGTHISWRQAWLRNSVEILFLLPAWYVYVRGYLSLVPSEYTHFSPHQKVELLHSLWPAWFNIVSKLETAWIWSEFIVILLNKRRRALHDFIAGTIVVQKTPTRHQAKDEDPYNIDFAKEMKRMKKL